LLLKGELWFFRKFFNPVDALCMLSEQGGLGVLSFKRYKNFFIGKVFMELIF